MRNKDIVIVGAGLAGSLAASMLGNASIDAILIDPQAVYPSDFRKFVSRIKYALNATVTQTVRLSRHLRGRGVPAAGLDQHDHRLK
jgi:2-polyprenyl-6-methoxyphenol hydroxylase-like FAD-dependent oxidoreductase